MTRHIKVVMNKIVLRYIRGSFVLFTKASSVRNVNAIPITRKMSIRLFEDKEHAALYSQYRPTYPDRIYLKIKEYYEQGRLKECNFQLAVDVGCGNGQSTLPLCKVFKQVIGCDVSSQQIASAPTNVANLSFRVGPGEDLSFLEDSSVDMITIAQALHWLDLNKFYPEVRRVLKPGGVFAAYGYGNNVLDNEEAHLAMKEFYGGLLGKYWDKQRRHIDECYRQIDHPFKEWQRIETDDISIRRRMPVEAYIGYLSTWSAWRSFLKENPETDALEKLRNRFRHLYNGGDVNVFWPGFMLIGRKTANENGNSIQSDS